METVERKLRDYLPSLPKIENTPRDYMSGLFGSRPEDVEYDWQYQRAGDEFAPERREEMARLGAIAAGGPTQAGDQARRNALIAQQQQQGAARSAPTANIAAQGRIGRGGAQSIAAEAPRHIAALEAAEQQTAQRQYLALQQAENARLQAEEQDRRDMLLQKEIAEAKDQAEAQKDQMDFWSRVAAGAATVGAGLVASAPVWGTAMLGIFSDEDLKRDVSDADQELYGFLDKLDAKQYAYKGDPAQAQRFGIMAQDAQESPVGRSMVSQERPYRLDPGQSQGVTLAALSSMHDRLKRLEGT